LRLSWTRTLLLVAGCYLGVNAIFAGLYWVAGGVAHAHAGLVDYFYFSVQTMGTIGYGAMFPESQAANLLVVLESAVSLVFTALVTGLVFAKFSRPTARVLFSRHATIAPMNGQPTLQFRLGNMRTNRIVEAQVRLALVRTELTAEGKTFYRMIDLELSRDRILSLARAWTVMHPIGASSPLCGASPESLKRDEVELLVTVSGTDDTWMQQVHSSHRYLDTDIIWGARHQDIVTDAGDHIVLDMTRFHEIEASAAADGFPYSHQPSKPR
jgi:inward rectifier potassium channel